MRKIIKIFEISIIVLLAGCSQKDDVILEQNDNKFILDNEISEDMISENELSQNEVPLNEVSENEMHEIAYYIKPDDIINFDVAFETYRSSMYDAPREVTVGVYNDNFPTELQDILIYCNDDIKDERDDYWLQYGADCEAITSKDAGDIPYEEICAAAYKQPNSCLWVLDIDGDGNDEYAAPDSIGKGQYGSSLTIVKYVDGKWTQIGGHSVLDSMGCMEILNYDNKLYLLMGEILSCWNDDTEIPDLSYWENDPVLGHDPCWNELEIVKTVTDYTPYEMYSNTRDDSFDYLENINWETIDDINAERVNFNLSIWISDSVNFELCYGWEKFNDDEQYLYVVARSYYERTSREEHDRVLTVLRQTDNGMWEIVRSYYLAANYDIELVLRED